MVTSRWMGRREFRHAFTMVELLIVISVIAVLVGLGYAAYWASIGSTQVSATKTTLTKLQNCLNTQWNSTTTQARTVDILPAAFPGRNAGNVDLSRAAWVMLRQEQAFPRTFADALAPTVLQAPYNNVDTYFKTKYQEYGITASLTSSSPVVAGGTAEGLLALESSVNLLIALQRSVNGTAFTDNQLGKTNIKTFTLNGGAKPVPALVDAWGQPLYLVFQGTTASGLPQLTPMLISAGKDNLFQTAPVVYNVTTAPANAINNKVTPAGDDLPSK